MADFDDFTAPAAEPASELDAFIDNLEAEGLAFDPAQVITITSTNGSSAAVPASEPMTVADLLDRAGLTASPSVQYYAGNSVVGLDYVVAPGGSITAVGVVKGG